MRFLVMIKWLFRLKGKINWLRVFVLGGYLALLLAVLYLPCVYRILRPKNELNVCTFADLIDVELIERFEEETGIKVNCKYCELDPEMWTQLVATGGKGLDLITPADFVAKRLLNAGLLQKIDKSLLSNLGDYHEIFLDKEFDKELDYCVPFGWNYYAIGYNKKFFAPHGITPTSLQSVFEPEKSFFDVPALLSNYKVAVFEDNPHELISLGSLYLFGSVGKLAEAGVSSKVIDLFVTHKRLWLYAYVSANMKYYLSSVVPIVISMASLLKDLLEEDGDTFGSCVPQEGTIFVPQNFCIPKGAKNLSAVHKFIDYFMSSDMLLEVFHAGGYLPVKKSLLRSLKEEAALCTLIPSEKEMKKLLPGTIPLTPRQVEQAWLAVKSAT
jgi:spermidine/putrescine-binding protein